MSFSGIHKAIYNTLFSKSADTFVGIRAAGSPLPCFVYEITSATIDISMTGVLSKNHWTLNVEVIIFGTTVDEVTSLVNDVASIYSSGPVNDTPNLCSLTLAGFSVVMGTESADDGMQDLTRTATISLTLLVQED